MIKEQAIIQIELFDADNGRIYVEFKRKHGPSMVFYDEFNMLRDKLAQRSDQQKFENKDTHQVPVDMDDALNEDHSAFTDAELV